MVGANTVLMPIPDALTGLNNRQISAPNNILAQAIGPRIDAQGTVRYNSDTIATATQFGLGVIAQAAGSCAYGAYAVALDLGAVAIGPYSQARFPATISVGEQSLSNGVGSVALGNRANISTPYSIAVGMLTKVTPGTNKTGEAVAIGYLSSVSGDYGVAIGSGAVCAFTNSIALGHGAAATQNSECIIGSAAIPLKPHFTDTWRSDGANQLTVGAAGAASALPATPTGYLVVNIAGTDRVMPYYAKV